MMKTLLDSAFYPNEIYALLKLKLGADPETSYKNISDIKLDKADKTYNRAMCFYFLNLTSRSFARVIEELNPELRYPICIFYLVLRGLDTVEDDMTIPFEDKKPLLIDFYKKIQIEGWNFTGNGDGEKDKPLLVDFQFVISEFLSLKKEYQTVIIDITKRMGEGMAEFRHPDRFVDTLEDYSLYTHYVAGLVGIGLTAIFITSGLEQNPKLILTTEKKIGQNTVTQNSEYLPNRMGQFLQKINILKDMMGDLAEGRVFWPKEIWQNYLPKDDKLGLKSLAKFENRDRAIAALNHLCADALELVPDSLEYMALLTDKSVFKFCAIPQVMAIASLTLFFNNTAIFNPTPLKIRRGQAASLILTSCENMQSLKQTYQTFIQQMHKKNHQALNAANEFDKSFVRVAVALGKMQRWINVHTMNEYANGADFGTRKALEVGGEMRRGYGDMVVLALFFGVLVQVFLL